MKLTTTRGKIDFVELSKLINKQNTKNIPNYNVKEAEAAVKKGSSIKSDKKNFAQEGQKCTH